MRTKLDARSMLSYALLIIAVASNGCSATGSYGSFRTGNKILVGDMTRKAFQYEGIDRHPVIVIPGIFGTQLTDPETKAIVWGRFTGMEMVANFSAEQLRLLSLPMEQGKDLKDLRDVVVPSGVLEVMKLRWRALGDTERAVIVATLSAEYRDAFPEWGEGVVFAPGFPGIERATAGTWSTLYEMMPFPSLGMVVDEKGEKLDLYDPALWMRMKWGLANPGQEKELARLLPEVTSPEKLREIALDHLTKSLGRAKRFAGAIGVDAI